jgi:uncharacterized protein (DUF342 family)
MAQWIEPKTDWNAKSYFNYTDYNRIIGNIGFLKAFLDSLFYDLTNTSLGEEKSIRSQIYAEEMNAIEKALESLNLETYKFRIGETKEYISNGSTPNYEEFNRIESAILKIYEQMINHKENLTRLEIRLGNMKGIRV